MSSNDVVIRYSNEYFNDFINKNLVYKLNEQIISVVNSISEHVGDPEYIKTPKFATSDNKKPNRRNINLDYKWNTTRSTIPITNIAKRQGIYACIDAIRKNLNKMTDKTYIIIKNNIVEQLKIIIGESKELIDDMNILGNELFFIASSNRFYSEIYANLYKELMNTYPFIEEIFKNKFNEFSAVFKTIEYVDPDTDYDKFCDINKMNEKRRALSSFYINLMINNTIEPLRVVNIIYDLNNYIIKLIDEKNNKNIVEELTEVVFIMIDKGKERLKKNEKWNEIHNQLKLISKIKVNSKPSISNKTIFKFMDIIDQLK